GWKLDNVACTGGDSERITNGVTIHLDRGEHINCTFRNAKVVQGCVTCDGPAVVIDTPIELDARDLAGTAGVLAPFAAFDGESIKLDLGSLPLHIPSTGRLSVLAGTTRQPKQFHKAGNHGTPNLRIHSTCELQIDESTRGLAQSKFRNLTGVIETTAL